MRKGGVVMKERGKGDERGWGGWNVGVCWEEGG